MSHFLFHLAVLTTHRTVARSAPAETRPTPNVATATSPAMAVLAVAVLEGKKLGSETPKISGFPKKEGSKDLKT